MNEVIKHHKRPVKVRDRPRASALDRAKLTDLERK